MNCFDQTKLNILKSARERKQRELEEIEQKISEVESAAQAEEWEELESFYRDGISPVNYIFYISDESFDYFSPFGTDTQHELTFHGFSLDLKDFSTFKAFGDFDFLEKEVKSLADLKSFIDANFSSVEELPETTIAHCYDIKMAKAKTNKERFTNLVRDIALLTA